MFKGGFLLQTANALLKIFIGISAHKRLVTLSQQGARSIHPQANQILQRVWKSKELPPIIKTFAWRLIRRAFATVERVARYSTHIDKHCATCGVVEDDSHLFFHCQLPRAV
jgi:hypothetical protein